MTDGQRDATDPSQPAFAGRFRHRARLGEGAMGEVNRAFDESRRHDVALKFLVRVQPDGLYRFKQEFRLLAELIHPNVVTLYELIADADRWAVAMELVEDARTLLDYVRPYSHLVEPEPVEPTSPSQSQPTRLSRPRALQAATVASDSLDHDTDITVANSSRVPGLISRPGARPPSQRRQAVIAATLNPVRLRAALIQLLDALDVVHHRGLLHRDIKPSNVLVDRTGRVVVCDFGLAVAADAQVRETAGTPAYMSPEQADSGEATEASDFYSVGVILYEALTGVLPVTGDTQTALMANKFLAHVRPPHELVPTVDETLARLSMQLLDSEPARRPRSDEIRHQLRAGRSARTSVLASVGTLDQARFVGRHRERAALEEALAETRRRGAVAVLVAGSSGVGKSALVATTCEQMRVAHDAVVLAGRCYQTESVPFKALDAVVDELSRHLASLEPGEAAGVIPDDIAALCELFPVLRRAPAVSAALAKARVSVPSHLVGRCAQRAFLDLVVRLTRTRPVVIVIDDLQWGDLDSAPFLRELLESRACPGPLLIATCRSVIAGRGAGTTAAGAESGLMTALITDTTLGVDRDVRTIDLDPLGRAEAATLVGEIVGSSSTELVEQVLDDAGGNPLFVTELAHAARDGHAVVSSGGLDGLLARRIQALSAEGRRLLEAAAVAAWPQPLSLLSRALQLTGEAAALAELRAARMVRVITGRDGELLTTYHDRIRETAVSRLSGRDKRRLHRRLARAFEGAAELDVEALASHWAGAGDDRRAGDYTLQAAENASAARAYRRAADHYERALVLCELGGQARARVEAERAHALFQSGAVRAAADAYARVADSASVEDAAPLRARALICLLRAGDMRAADRMARRHGSAIGVKIPRSAVTAVASVLWGRLKLIAAKPSARTAHGSRGAPPQVLRRLSVAKHVGTALGLTDTIPGLAVQLRYVRESMRYGEPRHMANAFAQFALYLSALHGAAAQARIDSVIAEAQKAADATGSSAYAAMVRGCRAMGGFFAMQRVRDHGEQLDDVLPHLENDPDFVWESDLVRLYATSAYSRAGAFSITSERLPVLMQRASNAGNEYLREQLSRQAGVHNYLAHDQPDVAHALLDSARPYTGRRATINTYYYQVNRADVEAYQGNWVAAANRAQKFWTTMRGSAAKRVAPTRCLSAYLLGRTSVVVAASRTRSGRDFGRVWAMLRELDGIANRLPALAGGLAAHLRALVAAADDRPEDCVRHLWHSLELLEQCQAGVHSMPIRFQLGRCLGGDEGTALVAESRAWAVREGVASLENFARWISPLELCSSSQRRVAAPETRTSSLATDHPEGDASGLDRCQR